MKKYTPTYISSAIFKGFMYFIAVVFPLILWFLIGIFIDKVFNIYILGSHFFALFGIAFWVFFMWWFDKESKKFEW